jgi:CRISPR-associated protein (TIGR02584 family)
MSDPCRFRRRVLIAVTGLSPQIVTETLYALAVQQAPAFIPTEVHLITTLEGANRARLSLLSESPGGFHGLRKDYALPEIDFSEQNIHVLVDVNGKALEDIRTPEDNRIAADLITSLVRELTADPDSALHVSIAGGRKTMGFFLGYALTLFGRPQDRLSHVLVSAPFESSYQFFYPTPYPKVIEVGGKELADTATAEVTLADIPFVSLRHGLPDTLLNGRSSYNEAVDAIKHSLGPASLVIDLKRRRITASNIHFHIAPAQLALLLVFARRLLDGEPSINPPSKEVPDAAWAHCYLKELRKIAGQLGDKDATERALSGGMDGSYFSMALTRLHQALKKHLGAAAAPYLINDGGCRPRRYSLNLPSSAVTLLE